LEEKFDILEGLTVSILTLKIEVVSFSEVMEVSPEAI
jgi:hypothetical protein